VAGGFLDVAEGNAGVEGSGDERVTQGVGSYELGYPGSSGDAAHDPPGGVSVDPYPVGSDEDRPVAAFADRQVDGSGRPRCERHGHDLASLAHDGERAVSPLQPEVLDGGADGFGDPQPVEG
jgi:hypothetical protein